MILVDTPVWLDHLRKGDQRLAALLKAGQVLAHPLVIGEPALGRLHPRTAILADLVGATSWRRDRRLHAIAGRLRLSAR